MHVGAPLHSRVSSPTILTSHPRRTQVGHLETSIPHRCRTPNTKERLCCHPQVSARNTSSKASIANRDDQRSVTCSHDPIHALPFLQNQKQHGHCVKAPQYRTSLETETEHTGVSKNRTKVNNQNIEDNRCAPLYLRNTGRGYGRRERDNRNRVSNRSIAHNSSHTHGGRHSAIFNSAAKELLRFDALDSISATRPTKPNPPESFLLTPVPR